MEKWWFNSILSNVELGYRCSLSKSMDSFSPFENTNLSEDLILNDTDKHTHSCSNSDNSSSTNVDHFRDILNFSVDDTFLVKDSNKDSYSIYFDIEKKVFEIETDYSFLDQLESSFYSYWSSSYLNNGSRSGDSQYHHYLSDTKSSWNNYINRCIDCYLRSQICIASSIFSGSNNYSESYIYSYICSESENSSESESASLINRTNDSNLAIIESSNDLDIESSNDLDIESSNDFDIESSNDFDIESSNDLDIESSNDFDIESSNDFDIESSNDLDIESSNDFDIESSNDFDIESSNDLDIESSNDLDIESSNDLDIESSNNRDRMQKYKHLWVQCENCYGLNYKKFFKSKMNLCEQCGYHLKMSSSDRIELLIDPATWDPMDEYMVSLDPIEFHSEEDPYKDRIDSYQRKTGLNEAVQTGTGQLNGIPVAVGVMDFHFMGGSMGSVVGEKITRLIEYATNQFLPLILVCASGGARMQEGSLSLMQMAKISSALYDYQTNKKLFYVSILTSPTTGGVTASFGMLGDIIIAEPNAYIAFAGKRVIEQTLNKTVPEGSQSAEVLFDKGLVDSIVPRNLLKGVLNELLQFHDFFPLNPKSSRALT
uniref:acetyl-CoA carboxylase carboxyltransferase beta subunit n=1 Tax=Euphorbia nutans TaxID=216481 RepID=UPI002410E977|nr:acetyl-CoA carboxylase carboxyltransferase beta subunit [Euphorbia nutans]WEH01446.1 acetyl-CoA carboxylase carboxyltransferase beta subunit [Euphorbia nutans]WHS26011.1 acetyl-CoA carboxylase subunit beta [Euphorbia nutans]